MVEFLVTAIVQHKGFPNLSLKTIKFDGKKIENQSDILKTIERGKDLIYEWEGNTSQVLSCSLITVWVKNIYGRWIYFNPNSIKELKNGSK